MIQRKSFQWKKEEREEGIGGGDRKVKEGRNKSESKFNTSEI